MSIVHVPDPTSKAAYCIAHVPDVASLVLLS